MKHWRALVVGAILSLGACGGGGTSALLPPAVPTGVEATAAAEVVSVTWNPVASASGYEVYLSPVAGRSRAELQADADVRTLVVRTGLDASFDALPAGTSWYVVVDAFNPAGRSPLSAEVGATLAPAAPEAVTATPLVSALEVAWDDVAGATTYDVYVSTDASLTRATWAFSADGREVADVTSPLVVEGLTGGRPHYALVVARNEGGTSPDSAVVAATPRRPRPVDVDDLVAEAGSGTVTLSWTVADPSAVYVLYLALEPGITKHNWQDLEGGQRHVGVTSPFLVEGLEPGTTVYFVVTVMWEEEEGPESDTASATPNARGTFHLADTVTVGSMPCDLVVADLDHDGVLDAVTANRGDGSITVCGGQADGHFGSTVDHVVGDSPCAIDVGDVDGDGIPDLAVALAGESAIVILQGDGSFGFDEVERLEAVGTEGTLRLVDVNGDDLLDVVAVHQVQNEIQVWLGDGQGGFEESDRVPTGEGPTCLVAADLDADGLIDLAVGNAGNAALAVAAGNGEGGFFMSQLSPAVAGAAGLLVEDWNGDGSPDLLLLGAAASSVEFWTREGDGPFESLSTLSLDSEPSALASGDFDGDGQAELVVLSSVDGTVCAFDRSAAGVLTLRQCIEGVACGCGQVAVRDVNDDGILDLIFCAEGANAIQILLGND